MPEQPSPEVPDPKEPSPATLVAWEAKAYRLEAENATPDSPEYHNATSNYQRAFGELYHLTYDQLYAGLASRSGADPEVIADLLQSTYERAHKGLPRFRGVSDDGELVQVTTWLHRIAYNRLATYFEKKSRQIPLDERLFIQEEYENLALEPAGNSPEELAEAEELRAQVEKALETLSPKVRAVIRLRHLSDQKLTTVAQMLGLGESAAKVRDMRGRNTLREYFKDAKTDKP